MMESDESEGGLSPNTSTLRRWPGQSLVEDRSICEDQWALPTRVKRKKKPLATECPLMTGAVLQARKASFCLLTDPKPTSIVILSVHHQTPRIPSFSFLLESFCLINQGEPASRRVPDNSEVFEYRGS